MEKLAGELEDVRFVKIHVDREGEVLAAFDASGIPAYIVFRDGVEVDRLLAIPGMFEWRLRRMLAGASEG